MTTLSIVEWFNGRLTVTLIPHDAKSDASCRGSFCIRVHDVPIWLQISTMESESNVSNLLVLSHSTLVYVLGLLHKCGWCNVYDSSAETEMAGNCTWLYPSKAVVSKNHGCMGYEKNLSTNVILLSSANDNSTVAKLEFLLRYSHLSTISFQNAVRPERKKEKTYHSFWISNRQLEKNVPAQNVKITQLKSSRTFTIVIIDFREQKSSLNI